MDKLIKIEFHINDICKMLEELNEIKLNEGSVLMQFKEYLETYDLNQEHTNAK